MKRILHTCSIALSLMTPSILIAMENNINNSEKTPPELPLHIIQKNTSPEEEKKGDDNYIQRLPKVILWEIARHLRPLKSLTNIVNLRKTNKKFYHIFARLFVTEAIQKNLSLWLRDPKGFSNIIPSLNLAYDKDVAEILTGYLLLYKNAHKPSVDNSETSFMGEVASKEYKMGIMFLTNKTLPKDIQKHLYISVSDPESKINGFGLNFTYEMGIEYLKKRSDLGDQNAQNHFNKAAYHGKLGFTKETGRKHLEERAKIGDQNAQGYLNLAVCKDQVRLNWAAFQRLNGFTQETGREYLEERAIIGDQNAQSWLNHSATFGLLGFTKETGRKYLEERAKIGDQNAQKNLNRSASATYLGFTNETGREYLEKRAKKDDKNAQKCLNGSAYYGHLGFTDETGRKYLEERSKTGDQNAQKWLNMSAQRGNLGFTKETGRRYLEVHAIKGDLDAQERLNEAAHKGKLGFTKETGRRYLKVRAIKGDLNAQKYFYNNEKLFFAFYSLAMRHNKK